MIYLRYSNDNWATNTSASFKELKVTKSKNRKVAKSETLQGAYIAHKWFSKSSNYDIIISANELYITSKYNYLLDFFKAKSHRLSFDDSTWIDVVLDDETFNEEFIEGNVNLPEVTLKFIQKFKD
jgi:hypothetical protein